MVDGEYVDAQDIRERAEEEDESDDAEEEPWRTLADALDDAEGDGCGGGAEGPMMNSFYRIERGGWGSFSTRVDLAKWAAKLDGLPLAAVEYDGDFGLALTGGGMDLSWEIAEGFLRLGYRVPQWIDRLPGMANRGESDTDRAIVRGVIRTQQMVARNAARNAELMAEQYGEVVED